MGEIETTRHPVAHSPGTIGGVDLELVELTEDSSLATPDPGYQTFQSGQFPMQLVGSFAPIPLIEHMFVVCQMGGTNQEV